MKFKKYQHIRRIGDQETEGITDGLCYIFYKIDGTNASVWLADGELKAGSRQRELTLENDNAGFYRAIKENTKIKAYLEKHPTHRLYGEWLVKHSLTTYRDDAWRKFYIFDVCLDKDEDDLEYIPYDIYKELLDEFDLEYIPPLAKIKNPTPDNLIKCLEKTGEFLIEDGKGLGEGIVIKNYDYYNNMGSQIWGKIVRVEFKEKHHKAMGCPEHMMGLTEEEKIIDKYCTTAFIEKEYVKIVNENNGWSSKYIPQLFGKIYYELITEEIWHILKEFKDPTINFKRLKNNIVQKVKIVKSDIFS